MTETGSRGERIRIAVDSPAAERLDVYLAAKLPDLSRTRIARLIADELVLRNGRPARKSERPEPGDVLEILVPPPEPAGLEPEPIPLDIVHEDEDLLVIDKPAGLVVHPAPGHRTGTLVHALLYHVPDLAGIGGVLRPGIVHRLDKDTSGLMLVAKNEAAHRALSAALKRRAIRRRYLVAAWGHLAADEVVVDAPIARSRTDRKRMAVREDGRRARTLLLRLERWPAADLIRAELESGRTHQIRVHLEHIGHPVVGDPVYGGGGARGVSGPARQWAVRFQALVPRQFLHAAELEFEHPRTGARVRYTAPLPPDLERAAEWARRG